MKVALCAAACAIGLVAARSCSSETCQAEDVSMLQSRLDSPSKTRWLDQVVRCMNTSTYRVGKKLGNVSMLKYAGIDGNHIIRGYEDMFDRGNYIAVSAQGYGFSTVLSYTQQCNGQWTSAGVGDVEYYTCKVDASGTGTPEQDASTLWFAGFRSKTGLINGLSVRGGLGKTRGIQKGFGFVKTGHAGCTRSRFCGTYSQTLWTGHPSINHLFIVPDDNWMSDLVQLPSAIWAKDGFPPPPPPTWNTGMRVETEISGPAGKSSLKAGGKPVYAAVYVLWGGYNADLRDTEIYTQAQFSEALKIITSRC